MKHQVTAKFAPRVVNKKDIEFVIKADGKKLGTLMVSKGNIEWLPAGNHTYKRTMNWGKFANMMEEHGRERRL